MRQPKRVVPRNIYWEHQGNRAVLDGDWKLVARHNGPWELYNLAQDRIEMKNLAAAQPARLNKMIVQCDTWAAHSQVVPWHKLKRNRA